MQDADQTATKPGPGRKKRTEPKVAKFDLKLLDQNDTRLVRAAGRQSRGETTPQALHLPNEIKGIIDNQGFGARSSIIIGLIYFALDELERQKKTLEIEIS